MERDEDSTKLSTVGVDPVLHVLHDGPGFVHAGRIGDRRMTKVLVVLIQVSVKH